MPLSIKDLHGFGSRLAVAVAQERPEANCGMALTGSTIPHPAIGLEIGRFGLACPERGNNPGISPQEGLYLPGRLTRRVINRAGAGQANPKEEHDECTAE